MILRKPFAILIKHFKLIHLILTILSFYLVYKTNLILSFYNEYMATYNSVIGKDLTGELYNTLMYVSALIILIETLIILGLMVFKGKKVKLYIYNLLVYIFVIFVYAVSYSITSSLEIQLVDVRTLKLVQDLLTTAFGLQVVSFVIVAIRATGFNVQKFDFTKDLQELEIEDVDSEEFEVNVDLNSDETKRKINRAIRHIKYIYKENRFIILAVVILALGITSLLIYMNVGVYNKVYKKGEAFTTNYYTLQLLDSYASDTDYKGNKLSEEEAFIIIHMNIQNNTSKDRKFDTARLVLNINEHYFYHETTYSEQMLDMGTIYNGQDIQNTFTDYVFIYKVPTEFLDNKIKLIYTDYNNKQIQMEVNPISLMRQDTKTIYTMPESVNLKESILGDKEFKIDSIEIADTFRVDYNYCIEMQCYSSYEYIKPTLSGNEKKALLKIIGTITEENNTTDLYTFMSRFGHIEYRIDGRKKTMQLGWKQIKPAKAKLVNEYYVEVVDELKNAESIELVFKIRNKIYSYTVK